MAGVVYKYGDQQRDYYADHLCLHCGLLFAGVHENDRWLDIDLSFGKFDLLQLELFHFYYLLYYFIPSSFILSYHGTFYGFLFYFVIFCFNYIWKNTQSLAWTLLFLIWITQLHFFLLSFNFNTSDKSGYVMIFVWMPAVGLNVFMIRLWDIFLSDLSDSKSLSSFIFYFIKLLSFHFFSVEFTLFYFTNDTYELLDVS